MRLFQALQWWWRKFRNPKAVLKGNLRRAITSQTSEKEVVAALRHCLKYTEASTGTKRQWQRAAARRIAFLRWGEEIHNG